MSTNYDQYSTWVLLYQTSHLMNKALERQLLKLGLTLTQAAVLWLADSGHRETISSMAHFLARETNSISELISRMEKDGLVDKVKTPGGGTHIELTPKGKELSRQARIVASASDMMDVLSARERNQFGSQLQVLRTSVVNKLAQSKADSLVAQYSADSLPAN